MDISEKTIMEAWKFLREKNSTIPSETLDFMKDAALEKLKEFKAEYDPRFGDKKLCQCGHPYFRHFDPYEDMRHVGCKYCECDEFKDRDLKIIDKIICEME